jgi:hypothetical protein
MKRASMALASAGAAGLWALAAPGHAAAPELGWQVLQPGVDYAVITGSTAGSGLGTDERLHVVRIDPGRAPLLAAMAKATDRLPRTAGQWCRERKLAVAINLGMYREDRLTNVGHAQVPGHDNNATWSKSYKSALAFAPTKKGIPAALMFDLDSPDATQRLAPYGAVVQNLRLIRAPGRGVWGKQERRWSEAAVGMDKQGRVLFIFTRRPYAMSELVAKLLALPLAITHAMHVEGGPEASLSIHAGGVDLDLNGSYETGFNENDGESAQWPIPTVLGVARRPAR